MSAFPKKKCYEGLRFNVSSVTRGWVGVKFPGKKRYVTLEWPLKGRVISLQNDWKKTCSICKLERSEDCTPGTSFYLVTILKNY